LVLVALDEKEQPIEVPRLILETDEEKAEWEAAAKRRQLRKQRRIEQF
jgi:acyl-CoA hydrolase